ncbi:hypothetical protein Lal_00026756 [Lupinus albus]|nr:hypothetical protein Lal_00026756 [Lupinus albus]
MDHKLPREFLSVNMLRFLREIEDDDSNEILLRKLRCSAKESHLLSSPPTFIVAFSPPSFSKCVTMKQEEESHSVNTPKLLFLAQARQLSLRRESSSIAQDFTLLGCYTELSQWCNAHSVYCIRHVASNFNKEFKDGNLKEKVIQMGYELMRISENLGATREFSPEREGARSSERVVLPLDNSRLSERVVLPVDKSRLGEKIEVEQFEELSTLRVKEETGEETYPSWHGVRPALRGMKLDLPFVTKRRKNYCGRSTVLSIRDQCALSTIHDNPMQFIHGVYLQCNEMMDAFAKLLPTAFSDSNYQAPPTNQFDMSVAPEFQQPFESQTQTDTHPQAFTQQTPVPQQQPFQFQSFGALNDYSISHQFGSSSHYEESLPTMFGTTSTTPSSAFNSHQYYQPTMPTQVDDEDDDDEDEEVPQLVKG